MHNNNNNLVVFGIDVSSRNSNVCEMMGPNNVIKSYEISNDALGFQRLLTNLKVFSVTPEIVFEATGVYSDRLQAFLDQHQLDYCRLNPLKAKQQLLRFRVSKTDQHDALGLANSQYIFHRRPDFKVNISYQRLKALSHYYDQLTQDLVTAKNRLHRVLQEVFPNLENLMSCPSGDTYWHCIIHFTHPAIVNQLGINKIKSQLLSWPYISAKRADYLAHRLLQLAQLAYPAVPADFPQTSQAQDYAKRILKLSEQRLNIIKQMIKTDQRLDNDDLKILTSIPGISTTTAALLIGQLGDIRRFRSPNALNAFVGVDLRHYESGEFVAADHISKRGNALARKILYRIIGQIESANRYHHCHIADYYERKKKSSQSRNSKKIAIAAVHKLIRTIYHLIIYDQTYDYDIATNS